MCSSDLVHQIPPCRHDPGTPTCPRPRNTLDIRKTPYRNGLDDKPLTVLVRGSKTPIQPSAICTMAGRAC